MSKMIKGFLYFILILISISSIGFSQIAIESVYKTSIYIRNIGNKSINCSNVLLFINDKQTDFYPTDYDGDYLNILSPNSVCELRNVNIKPLDVVKVQVDSYYDTIVYKEGFPDLMVSDVFYNASTDVIYAKICNEGSDLNGSTVKVYFLEKFKEIWSGEKIKIVNYLKSKDCILIPLVENPSQGSYYFDVFVDPSNWISEGDEENNELERGVEVNKTLPEEGYFWCEPLEGSWGLPAEVDCNRWEDVSKDLSVYGSGVALSSGAPVTVLKVVTSQSPLKFNARTAAPNENACMKIFVDTDLDDKFESEVDTFCGNGEIDRLLYIDDKYLNKPLLFVPTDGVFYIRYLGTPCYSNRDCPEESFCEFPVGECKGPGMCVYVPDQYNCGFAPLNLVCGCDNVTYRNDCYRKASMVSKRLDGPCTSEGNLPDLTITNISLEEKIVYGQETYAIKVTVKNIGREKSPSNGIKIRLSPPQPMIIPLTNGSIKWRCLKESGLYIPELNPGEEYLIQDLDRIAPGNEGYLTIKVIADAFQEVDELNEENNIKEEIFFVEKKIDLYEVPSEYPGECLNISCTDSDSGLDYFTKGTVTYNGETYEDYCSSDSTVVEYFCKDGIVERTGYRCPNGCYDGACMEFEWPGGYDQCEYGGGWSEPSSSAHNCGWPPGKEGYVKDCCCCYLTAHIHDLGDRFGGGQDVEIKYMPGLYEGCTSPMYIYSSLDGETWELFYTTTVTQETWHPKTVYTDTITVPNDFRYIKIEIPKCYVDFSSVKVLGTKFTKIEEQMNKAIAIEGLSQSLENNVYKAYLYVRDIGTEEIRCDEVIVYVNGYPVNNFDCVPKEIQPGDVGIITFERKLKSGDRIKVTTPGNYYEITYTERENVNVTLPTLPEEEKVCDNGCYYNDRCIPFGTRLMVNNESVYCDIDSALKKQKEEGEECMNNYECKSNLCSNGKCYNLEKEMKETKGLLQAIIDFFKKLFGLK